MPTSKGTQQLYVSGSDAATVNHAVKLLKNEIPALLITSSIRAFEMDDLPMGVARMHRGERFCQINRHGRRLLGIPAASQSIHSLPFAYKLGEVVTLEAPHPYRHGPVLAVRAFQQPEEDTTVVIFEEATPHETEEAQTMRTRLQDDRALVEGLISELQAVSFELRSKLSFESTQRPELSREEAALGAAFSTISRIDVLSDRLSTLAATKADDNDLVDIALTLSENSAVIEAIAGKRTEVTIESELTSCFIPLSKRALIRILTNVTLNAREAMPDGGSLHVRLASEATASKPGPCVCLSITDDGNGMDESIQTHVFDPFFTTKSHNKSRGMGLTSVLYIMRDIGGHIEIDSEPGIGTTVKLYFPVKRKAALSQDEMMLNEPEVSLSDARIGIVEADADLASVLTDSLEAEGFEAVNLGLPRSPDGSVEAVDLCFVGHLLNEVTMRDLLQTLRSRGAATRIVVAVEASLPDNEREGLPGDITLIQRPFTFTKLLDVIRSELT